MGTKIAGVDVAKLVAKTIGPKIPTATLIKVTPGARADAAAGGVTHTKRSFPCRALVSDFSIQEKAQGLVQDTDVKVLILAASLPEGIVPAPNDRIRVRGAEFVISGPTAVVGDPAEATYTVVAR